MHILSGKQYDVIVCGCGSAGFCAAIQAARAGMKTAVVEKYGMPGGTLTVMGNNSIDQFNNPFRTSKKMIIQGIGWEFVQRLARMGYAVIPDMNAEYRVHWQYGVKVNPVAAAKLMDDYFVEQNIDVYYNQPAVSVEAGSDGNGTHVDSVILATKSGLTRLTASAFIDCTGDGDLCVWAGADYECGGEGLGELQPGTLRLYLKKTEDVDLSEPEQERAKVAIAEAIAEKRLFPGDLFCREVIPLLKSMGDNINHIPGFNSADSDSKTFGEMEGRRSALRLMDVLKKAGIPAEIISCAPEVAPRESRRILCDGYITCDDYINCRLFPDSICYSFWFIDLHRPGSEGNHIVYLKDGRTPSIPLSVMIPRGLTNVFVAGRCISGDRLANSAIRVKASCMAMGQAAGAAAAVAVRSNHGESRRIDLTEVKKLLAENDAVVPGYIEPKEFGEDE